MWERSGGGGDVPSLRDRNKARNEGGLGMTPNQPRGSVFWVRLPLVRLQAAPPQPEDDIDDGR